MEQMTAAASHGHGHLKLGFWRAYVFSTDHKVIGKQYLTLGLCMALLGGASAYVIRWQLAWPETPIPLTSWVPEPAMFEGQIDPNFYNQLVTMHGTIMVFFVAMPMLLGGLRQLPDAVDGRRRRHGVPAPQHDVVLDDLHSLRRCCLRRSSCRAVPRRRAGRATPRSRPTRCTPASTGAWISGSSPWRSSSHRF